MHKATDVPYTSTRLAGFVINDRELWRIIAPVSEPELMGSALTFANLVNASPDILLRFYLEIRFGQQSALDELAQLNPEAMPKAINLSRQLTAFRERWADRIEEITTASTQQLDAMLIDLLRDDGQRVLMRPAHVRGRYEGKEGILPRHRYLFADDDALFDYLSTLFVGRQLLGEQQLYRCVHCRQFFTKDKSTKGAPRTRFCSSTCMRKGKRAAATERQRKSRAEKRGEKSRSKPRRPK